VGVYLARNDRRVYEVEARISWDARSDLAQLDFSTDLPGWEGTGSPEAVMLGRRFARKAADEGLVPSYWVLFTEAIQADPELHRRLCPAAGVYYQGRVPAWATPPDSLSLPVQDLREIGLSVRSAL
jgi:hypothetical protein